MSNNTMKGKVKALGAVTPVNNLNRSNQMPARYIPPVSAHFPLNLPSLKRQKVAEQHTHTKAHFMLADYPESRKRSIDEISDSQRTIRSQSLGARGPQSTQAVKEYRDIESHVRARPRKRPRASHEARSSEQVVDGTPLIEMEDSDGEVSLVAGPKSAATSQTPQKKDQEHPISYFVGRFAGAGPKGTIKGNLRTPGALKVENIIDKRGWEKNHHKSIDSSPDELALEARDTNQRVPAKRPVTLSPSLSKRGDIVGTKFPGSSHPKPHKLKGTTDEMARANEIIGTRLRIRRAVSGQFKYEADKADSVDECFLRLREVCHLLHPTNLDGEVMKQYSYATINLKKVGHITFPSDPDCCTISISRMVDATISAGAKLAIEFKSLEDLLHFRSWVEMDKEGVQQPEIKHGDQKQLEKELNNLIGLATNAKTLRDEDVGNDIKLIEHNLAKAKSTDRSQVQTRKKKDMMRPSVLRPPSAREVTVISDEPQHRDARPQRQSRTTRSTFAVKSHSKSPEIEGWTVQNKGWEGRWRNSLVFPPHGKNRAIVDKEDIPRLDEGQFLNDNLIIFYLRYLQHSLEAEKPDLAQRIYFQNTFFYEKLKSTKTSHGINFDSVKAWTSKVDLFSKDFIIVPINEFSHWYVAIIYNAPKLLPSADKMSPDTCHKEAITIEEDAADDSGGVSSASLLNKQPVDPAAAETVISTAHIDMAGRMSRMSICSSDPPDAEAKQTIATDPLSTDTEGRKADVQSTDREQDIEVIHDKDDSKAEVKEIPSSSGSLQKKKTTKKHGIGPRKYSPDQPRIITLDSLDLTHSPACSCLRYYLIEELKDKKGVEIPIPGPLGMTAKGIPQQSNYCDCGLYLLGYIQEFLKNPDKFVRSLLQRDVEIEWNLDPSRLRSNIRDLIFELQKEQQDRENALIKEKRKAGMPLKRKRSVTEQQPHQQSALPVKEQTADQQVSAPLGEASTPNRDESMVRPETRSPTPEVSHSEARHAPDSAENCRIPGSFPQTPSPVIERVNLTDTSTVIDLDSTKTETPKFVSPLSVTDSGSSATEPMFVNSEASQGFPQKTARSHGDPNQASSRVEVIKDSRQSLQNYSDPNVRSRNQKGSPTESPYFAGRQPGDRMPSAKLREVPDQPAVVVDLSD
ncbi:cysteine proteinase [Hypoxylon sp. NC1633]|nr:cysteine proteinase [Hypoxylon sp. NC1633]